MSAEHHARAAVDCLDEIAIAMERKWGVDRLRRLVDPALAARFDAQGEKLGDALRSDRHDAIVAQAGAMERAWKALDANAIARGARPLSPTVWEAIMPSGEVVAIVRTPEEAHALIGERGGAVFTLAEVAIALEAFGDRVRAVKEEFPGASVTAVRTPALNIGGRAGNQAAGAKTRGRRGASTGKITKATSELLNGPSKNVGAQPLEDGFDWAVGDEMPF